MERELSVIEGRAPARLLAERDRLRAAIRELSEQGGGGRGPAGQGSGLSVRAMGHQRGGGAVPSPPRWRSRRPWTKASRNPVGKRLGFLVQEMHREANTIASKANDVEISQAPSGHQGGDRDAYGSSWRTWSDGVYPGGPPSGSLGPQRGREDHHRPGCWWNGRRISSSRSPPPPGRPGGTRRTGGLLVRFPKQEFRGHGGAR